MSDRLAEAIATQDPHTDPGELAPAAPTGLEGFGAPDPSKVLAVLGLDVRDVRAHAVVLVAERYGLDPLLGHVMIIPKSQRPYITRDGYLHIAHSSGAFDGMAVTDGPRRDPQEREWTAKVAVYRKDMSRPFEFPGRAELGRDNGPEMALARAERRSLRRAFDVTLPQVFADDEYDDRPLADDLPAGYAPAAAGPAPEPSPAAAPMSDAQRRAILARFRERGTERAERIGLLRTWTGREVTSVKDLTGAEASEVLARLAETDADVGAGAAAEPPDAEPQPVTRDQLAALNTLLRQAGITDRSDARALVTSIVDRAVASASDLTSAEAAACIGELKRMAADREREQQDQDREEDYPDADDR